MEKSPRLKICIVDHDIVAQFAASIRVHQSGIPCDISCFGDFGELLGRCRGPTLSEGNLPDIIIMDPGAPGFNGRESLEELKEMVGEDLYPEVYLLSAYSSGARCGAREHGLVRDLLKKPVSGEVVAGILFGAVERKAND